MVLPLRHPRLNVAHASVICVENTIIMTGPEQSSPLGEVVAAMVRNSMSSGWCIPIQPSRYYRVHQRYGERARRYASRTGHELMEAANPLTHIASRMSYCGAAAEAMAPIRARGEVRRETRGDTQIELDMLRAATAAMERCAPLDASGNLPLHTEELRCVIVDRLLRLGSHREALHLAESVFHPYEELGLSMEAPSGVTTEPATRAPAHNGGDVMTSGLGRPGEESVLRERSRSRDGAWSESSRESNSSCCRETLRFEDPHHHHHQLHHRQHH